MTAGAKGPAADERPTMSGSSSEQAGTGGGLPSRRVRLSAPLLDVFGGILFLALAVWLWTGASSIDESNQGLIGPTGFPRGIAILLGGSALVMALKALRAARARTTDPVTLERPSSVLAAIVLVILYPILIERLGYYVATGLWLLPFFWVSGCRKPLLILSCAGGFLIFTKLLFQTVLGTPLP